jgi:hypothetical protein
MPRELHRIKLKHEQTGVYAYEDYTIILIISHHIMSPFPWPSLMLLKAEDIVQVNCLKKHPCRDIVTVGIPMPHLQLRGSARQCREADTAMDCLDDSAVVGVVYWRPLDNS